MSKVNELQHIWGETEEGYAARVKAHLMNNPEEVNEAPERTQVTLTYCPLCQRDNQIQRLSQKHLANGQLCPNRQLRTAVYELRTDASAAAKVPAPNADTPEGCDLVAHDTGDGWALAVEYEHEVIAYLKWPDVWPETLTRAELNTRGFIIV